MIPAVQEVLAGWDDGLFSRGEVHGRLFEQCGLHGIDPVLAALPPPWRDELVAWMRTSFDNDVPVEEFVWLANTPEPPGRRELIATAREWLRRNRG